MRGESSQKFLFADYPVAVALWDALLRVHKCDQPISLSIMSPTSVSICTFMLGPLTDR